MPKLEIMALSYNIIQGMQFYLQFTIIQEMSRPADAEFYLQFTIIQEMQVY